MQYAASGNTISEGGQSASVGPGTYNVINHTTGERFENIAIGQDNGGASQRSSLDILGDSPTTADRLGARNATDYGPGGIRDGYPPSTVTTVDPETDWVEVSGDAVRDGIGATYGAFRGGVRHPGLLAEVFVTGAVISAANNVDTETVPNPDAVPNSERYGQNDGDIQGGVSSSQSAEDGNWGTDPEGEFGDSSTQPSTGSGTTDSGLSTSLEAANEYSNGNTGGEYGGTPTAPEPVSQPTSSRPSLGSRNVSLRRKTGFTPFDNGAMVAAP